MSISAYLQYMPEKLQSNNTMLLDNVKKIKGEN